MIALATLFYSNSGTPKIIMEARIQATLPVPDAIRVGEWSKEHPQHKRDIPLPL